MSSLVVVVVVVQGPEHPNPGKPFTARGFPRHCYLPDSEKGRKVQNPAFPVAVHWFHPPNLEIGLDRRS